MDLQLKVFLELCSSAILNKPVEISPNTKIDWEQQWDLSLKHNMNAILYQTVEPLLKKESSSQKIMDKWKQSAFSSGIYQWNKNCEIQKLVDICKKKNIDLIIFKGPVLASLYPEPLMRISTDTDIFIYEEDKLEVEKELVNQGFIKNEIESLPTVLVYKKNNIASVELHTCLWEEFIGERVKKLEKMNFTDKNTLIKLECCDMSFKTFGYNEQLVYIIYHAIKHFSISGIGVRHLIDITLYINKYIEYLDMKLFWKRMKELNYTVCCSYFFTIGISWFGLISDVMEYSGVDIIEDTEDIIRDIIEGGVFGNASLERYHARNIIMPYLRGDIKANLSKVKLVYGVIFPGSYLLKNDYGFAKKYPILIPIAWLFRIRYLLSKYISKKRHLYGKKTMNQAQNHLRLLRELEIIRG